MDKIRLSSEDIEFILRWRDENPHLVRLGMSPRKAVKIVCYETGYTITAVRDGNRLNFVINHNGKSLGKIVFEKIGGGLCSLVEDKTKISAEDRQAVLTVYSSTMALLVFGNTTISQEPIETRELLPKQSRNKSQKRNKKGFTYILTRTANGPSLKIEGSHNSPQGEFSVRGHFRHYKNGKVIWIAEFTKGCGKRKDKTYKVGKAENERSKKMD